MIVDYNQLLIIIKTHICRPEDPEHQVAVARELIFSYIFVETHF